MNKRAKITFTTMGISFAVFLIVGGIYFISFVGAGGGDGSSGNPFQITTCDELNNTRNNLTASYILMNDINFSECDSSYTTGEGWLPIGNITSGFTFTGTFDGQNNTISDLVIDKPETDNVGLFGFIGIGGEVKGTILTNVNVSGNSFVGGLAGYNRGDIYNSSTSGIVKGEDRFIGGLVGCHYLSDGDDLAKIKNSFSNADILGEGYLGGLVGYSEGEISDSYAKGKITGRVFYPALGGLVGENYKGKIINSYSTGSIHYYDGDDPTNKGFVGTITIGGQYEMYGNFWDINTSLQNSTEGNATGKTTTQMKNISTFSSAGWNISISEVERNDGYAFLSWEVGDSTPVWYINENPIISVLSPTQNQIFTQDEPTTLFNVSLNFNADICYYNNGSQNFSMANDGNYWYNTTAGSQYLDGSNHQVTFYCNSSSTGEWVQSETINFSIDSFNITRCRNLNVNNRIYYLLSNINSIGDCSEVTGNNITLNGNGKTITGDGTGIGIKVTGQNSTIENIKINSFPIRIQYSSSNYNLLSDSLFDGMSTTNIRIIDYVNSNNNEINNISTSGNTATNYYGIYFSESSNNQIEDYASSSNTGTSNRYDVYATSNSRNNIFLSSEFTYEYTSATSNFSRQWYFDTQVNDSDGDPLDLAVVKIWDSGSAIVYDGVTFANGRAAQQQLIEYNHHQGSKITKTPHTINVSKSGYPTNSSSVSVTEDTFHQVILDSPDITPPYFIEIPETKIINYTQGFDDAQFGAKDDKSKISFYVNDSRFSFGGAGGLSGCGGFPAPVTCYGTLQNSSANLPVGTYSLNITINDTSGNKNSTLYIVIVQDNSPPYFTQIPSNQQIVYGNVWNGVQFQAEDETEFGTYSINDTTNFQINSTGFLNWVGQLSVGNYYVEVTINDTAGNENSTIYNLNITKATPTGIISGNGTFEYPYQSTIQGTETNSGDGGCEYKLYRNGVEVSNPETITLGVGSYTYIYNTTGCANYSTVSSLDQRTLQINKNSSLVLGISGTTPINYGTTTNVAGSGCPSQLTCSLDKENGIYGAGTVTFNYSTSGNENYTATSITKDIVINKVSSTISLLINGTAGNQTGIYGVGTNVSVSLGNNEQSFTLYQNGADVTSQNNILRILGANNYNFTAVAEETQNYTRLEITRWSNINKANSLVYTYLNNTRGNVSIYRDDSILINSTLQTGVGQISLYINNSLNQTGSSPISISRSFGDLGNFNITTVYSGNENYSGSYETFWVDVLEIPDNEPPTINIISPIATDYSNKTQTINIEASDDVLVETVWYNWNGTNVSYLGPTYATFNEGTNTLHVYANDTSGNQNYTNVTFLIDTSAPILNIISPQPISYGSETLDLKYTVSDEGVGLDSCWYQNGTGSPNITISCGENTTITQTEGSHTLYMWANDTLGNLAFKSVTYQIGLTSPNTDLRNPSNNIYFNSGQNILFNFSSSDDDGIDTCELWGSWNGWHKNQTLDSVSSGVVTNFETLNLSEGSYVWNVWCNDTLGNGDFALNNFTLTIDTTYPSISFGALTLPTNSNKSQSNVLIDVILTEINFKNITYFLSGSSPQTYLVETLSHNFTSIADGEYSYNVTICDLANNCNSTETRTILLDTISPNVESISPINETVTNIPEQNFSVNITDENPIKNATLYVYNETGLYSTNSTDIDGETNIVVSFVVNLVDGVYNWFWKIFDWSGNSKQTDNRTITIDTENPDISIDSPLNTTYADPNQLLIISSSDNLEVFSTWYNWNGTNVSYLGPTNINFGTDGSKTIFSWVNDTAGNEYSASVTFTIDTSSTSIQIVSPTNTSYNNATQLVNISSNRDNVWYNWNGTNITYENELFINFNEGSNTLIAYTNDTFGEVSSASVNFLIDTFLPLIEFGEGTEINYANKSQSNIFINTTWTEENFKNITFRANGQTQSYSSPTYSHNFTGLSQGEYLYNVTICDMANNCNSTTNRIIYLDTTAPNINLISPTNDTMTNIPENNLTANITDINIKNASLEIYDSDNNLINQTNIDMESSGVVGVVYNFAEGVFGWLYKAWDWAGNLFTSEKRTITIDLTSPIINLISPTNTTYSQSTILLDISVSENFVVDKTWYNWKGTNYTYTTPLNLTATAGSNVIVVYANDTAGNEETSTTYFTISYTDKLEIISLSTDLNPEFGRTIKLQALTETDNTNIVSCNFSLVSPTGNIFLNELGVSDENPFNEKWNSTSSYLINETGVYNYNVTCVNDIGTSQSATNSFNSTYNLFYTPINYSFASRVTPTETNNITVYLYDNVNTTIIQDIVVNISNQSSFTLTSPSTVTLNNLDSSTNQYSFVVSVKGNEGVENGTYYGNITMTNRINGNITIIPFVYGIRPPSGIPQIRTTVDAVCTRSSGNCDNTVLSLTQGSSTTINYKVTNIGLYDLASCNVRASNSLSQSWITTSPTLFSLNQLTSREFSVTLSPTTSTSAQTYEGFIYIHCGSGDALGSAIESETSNRPYLRLQVNTASQPPSGGGGGGGGTTPEPEDKEPPKVEDIIGICGNGICEPEYGENYQNCAQDCKIDYSGLSSCFSSDPEIRKDCVLLKGTALFYVFTFIILVILLSILFTFKNSKKKTIRTIKYGKYRRGKF